MYWNWYFLWLVLVLTTMNIKNVVSCVNNIYFFFLLFFNACTANDKSCTGNDKSLICIRKKFLIFLNHGKIDINVFESIATKCSLEESCWSTICEVMNGMKWLWIFPPKMKMCYVYEKVKDDVIWQGNFPSSFTFNM